MVGDFLEECAMAQAKDGDKVRIHYTGTLEDGTTFDSSLDREPLEFVLGEGKVIAGFDAAVLGLEVGEKKSVTIPPTEAYGERNDALVGNIPLTTLPEGMEPEIGVSLELRSPDGNVIPVTITELTETEATLDGNHPLAGETLNFDVELVEIV
jgi:peptidylprolyl isomerase